jgi:DNA polymerase delta subunit 2
MPLKPSILRGLESVLGAKKVESFVNLQEDFLIVEDSSGRVRISNSSPMIDFSSGNLVTGIIAAIKGKLEERGLFSMDDIIFYNLKNYTLPPRIKNTIAIENASSIHKMIGSDSNLIAFVSGLHFGKTDYTGKLPLARNLFLNLLQGRFSSDNNLNLLFKRIQRLVIAGNSINSPDETDLVEKGSYLKADLNLRVYKTIIQNFDDFDSYLNILSHLFKVDLMPGSEDNSSSYFPALPINPIMLPNSSNNSTVNLIPNPYKFELDEINFLGTSGQNVDNIRKYSNLGPNSVDILEKTLQWCHISPSAPDTCRSFPTIEMDPLFFKEIPNVYFTGNQDNFETKLSFYNGVPLRLIAIPDFSKTFSFVLMDMNTLEACEYQIEMN